MGEKESEPFQFAFNGFLKVALQGSRVTSDAGTVIVVDNVVRDGKVARPSDDESAEGMRKFMAVLAAERRATATVVQTVGVKGYDGFAIAVVDSL